MRQIFTNMYENSNNKQLTGHNKGWDSSVYVCTCIHLSENHVWSVTE